jgi:enoyl-CoA hydratase
MVYENLLLERSDSYAVVTLNRPKVMNALNRALFAELDDAFTVLAGERAVRAIILTGAGEKAFAAGADISELATLSAAEGQQLARRGQGVFRRIDPGICARRWL